MCACISGFEYNTDSSSCIECSEEEYKTNIGNNLCQECSKGLIVRNTNNARIKCIEVTWPPAVLAGLIIGII
ncbi:MAG: hypothetical protein MHPSP_004655, partial [Paramarteilia canceri]